jgi:hypothetical protein
MARSIEEIQNIILTEKEKFAELNALNSSSKTAIWRLWVYIFAFVQHSLEQIFDRYKAEMMAQLRALKPHTARWYHYKALNYQDGFALQPDSDVFETNLINPSTGLAEPASQEQITASKIIKYAAVVERDQRLVIKIAGESTGLLKPIAQDAKTRFEYYISQIKDAGVPIRIINYPPDRLQLKIKIYRDPLVLDENGFALIGGNKPLEDAILNHIKSLPFNGELILAHLIDQLQLVEGVKIPHLQVANTAWVSATDSGYNALSQIEAYKVPESGYFEVSFDKPDFKTEISYVVQN